ncbi:MAG: hypothetical protein GXZ13_02625 [Synergistaceae bacterium]|nr:hypothetical protein [Synergistaceae bacterium]
MRKLLSSCVIGLVVVFLVILSMRTLSIASGPYVASKLREPFHYASCKWAQKIDPENIIYYPTREAAINDGHRPCKVCKP